MACVWVLDGEELGCELGLSDGATVFVGDPLGKLEGISEDDPDGGTLGRELGLNEGASDGSELG